MDTIIYKHKRRIPKIVRYSFVYFFAVASGGRPSSHLKATPRQAAEAGNEETAAFYVDIWGEFF